MSAPEIAVLAHHKIGPIPPHGWASWYYVAEEIFAAQLRLLQERGYAPLDLAAFLDGIERPETLPAKSALITFDDGYHSFFRHGLPQLREAGFPAVVFMPTDLVGQTNSFDMGQEPEEKLCTWDELRELEACGVAIQPHAASHRAFSGLTDAELEREIAEPKRLIEEHLGRPASLFSFPFGDNSTRPDLVDALLRKHGYRAALLYKGGTFPLPAANPFRLTRIALGADSDLASLL